jgi:hypothetical protein
LAHEAWAFELTITPLFEFSPVGEWNPNLLLVSYTYVGYHMGRQHQK